jgi:hypothetical protein
MTSKTRVVIHAGMGKAGSTSIQEWLRVRGARLRAESGIATLVATVDGDGALAVVPHERGSTNSIEVIGRILDRPDDRDRVLDAFVSGLAAAADRFGTVVLSSETFARPIAYGDEDLVRRLDDLAGGHEVAVAYYVRPQHRALESGWRHWRSNRETRPSEFIARIDRELHHRATLEFVRAHAPRVAFEMRPCRPDLLRGGDVVSDFATTVLGLVPDETMQGYRENAGVPVEVATALTALPRPHPWPPTRDPLVLDTVKELWAGAEPAASARAALARDVLQQACHDRYEPANRELIALLGWETDSWVPPVPGVTDASFDRMDELWRTEASAAELELLQRSLGALVDTRRELDALRARRAVRGALTASRWFRR